MDWAQCIYYQSWKWEKLHQVQSDDVAGVIRKQASFDKALKYRIGENDVIAYEAHYHWTCKEKVEKSLRNSSVHKQEIAAGNKPFSNLTNILDKGFEHGNIYGMHLVVQRYISLQKQAGVVNPSTQTRTLKQQLEKHYGNQVLFQKQQQANQPQLLIPAHTTTEAVVALVRRDQQETISPEDDDIDQSLTSCIACILSPPNWKLIWKIQLGIKGMITSTL